MQRVVKLSSFFSSPNTQQYSLLGRGESYTSRARKRAVSLTGAQPFWATKHLEKLELRGNTESLGHSATFFGGGHTPIPYKKWCRGLSALPSHLVISLRFFALLKQVSGGTLLDWGKARGYMAGHDLGER